MLACTQRTPGSKMQGCGRALGHRCWAHIWGLRKGKLLGFREVRVGAVRGQMGFTAPGKGQVE